MSSGLAELMQKINSSMTNQNKIGSTTTVNEQVDEMDVLKTLYSQVYISLNVSTSLNKNNSSSLIFSSRNSNNKPKPTLYR